MPRLYCHLAVLNALLVTANKKRVVDGFPWPFQSSGCVKFGAHRRPDVLSVASSIAESGCRIAVDIEACRAQLPPGATSCQSLLLCRRRAVVG